MVKKEDETIRTKVPTIRTAAQTAVLMSVLTLVSKLLGFLREMIMASYFGTSYVVDAYVMAQAIPSMLFAGILGSVHTAYMPLFSAKMEQEGEKSGNRFTSQVILLLLVASAISALVGLVFAKPLVGIFARGFAGKTAELTIFFVQITFSYTLFSSTAAIFEAFLQYKRTFIPQVIVGYTQNLLVITTIVLSAFAEVRFLAFGLLFAYIVRLFCMSALSKKKGFSWQFGDKRRHNKNAGISVSEENPQGLKEVAAIIIPLAVPVFIGSSISQIGLIVDRFLASGLAEGSVAALNYSNILTSMVSTLSLSILVTMIYPRLTQSAASGEMEDFTRILQKGMNLIIIIALPFSLGAMIYAHQIVQIIFERGAFDPSATAFTGAPYICYSAGMVFVAIASLMGQSYYAMQDTKTPMICGIICVIIDIILNFVLVRFMAHSGLALSTSIGSMVNAILLYRGFRKKYPDLRPVQSWAKVGKIVLSAVLAVGISYIGYQFIILSMAHVIYMRTVQVGCTILFAVIIYLFMLRIFKLEELSIIKELFKRQ